MRLLVRIPGWSQERVLGGHLYRFERPSMARPSLRINGEAADITLEKGYAVIGREWQDEDIIELSLPMPVRTVACDPRVISNLGKAAVQRGPLVYCVEGRDAAGPLGSLQLDGQGARGARLEAQWRPDLLGGVVAIRGPGFTAIPYFAWSNRGAGPMRVWLERTQSAS